MATHYSDLYVRAAGMTTPDDGTRIYRGPHGHMAKGTVFVVRGEIVIPTGSTIGASDVAKLLVAHEGAKVLRLAIVPSADLDGANTFTFNLGWTSASNALASASAGLQGTAAYTLAMDATIAVAAAGADGDELILTRVAGALSAGTLRFAVEMSA